MNFQPVITLKLINFPSRFYTLVFRQKLSLILPFLKSSSIRSSASITWQVKTTLKKVININVILCIGISFLVFQLVWIRPYWVEFARNAKVCNKSDQTLTSIRFHRISTPFHFRQPQIFDPLQQPFCGWNLASIPEKLDSNRVSRFPSPLRDLA